MGHQNTQRKGCDRLRDDPDALIIERIAMTGRLYLNIGAVDLVRMRGYTWSVELGDEICGIVLTGKDAQILHSIEGVTSPLILSRTREAV